MGNSGHEHSRVDWYPPNPHNVILLHTGDTLLQEERREAAIATAPPGWLQFLLVCPPPAGVCIYPSGDALLLLIPHQAVVQENGIALALNYVWQE